MNPKPRAKPGNPNFSSGPCSKRPGYDHRALNADALGRSHRSALGKARLAESIQRTKALLQLPKEYLLGIVPGSDTGAMELAMWNLLGERAVDVVCFESFGNQWAKDITQQLKLQDTNVLSADYGDIPDLQRINFAHDLVFTWNGTTSGVKVPNGDFIPDDRAGITICDATSAVFAMELPWTKLDVTCFSWQKVLGGEAAHGMIVLSPKAVDRLNTYTPAWPLPKVFQLKSKGMVNTKIFEGSTINTPSMLCNEDYLNTLGWAESIGGLQALISRSENNLKAVESFVEKHDWIGFLAAYPEIRSNTSVCLKVDLRAEELKRVVKLLEQERVAFDVASYRDAPSGLRFWCGATVETKDIQNALEWLGWAYSEVQK